MAKAPPNADVDARLEALESKASSAEKWLWVVTTVAVIFGLSLTKIWQDLGEARKQADQAKKVAATAVVDLKRASEDATNAIRAESGAILESHRPAFDKWVTDVKAQLDRWPTGSYAILRGNGPCPAGFQQVDSFIHAVASFMPDPGKGDPAAYIKQADFGASSIRCHGGANCAAYIRPAPHNINWLGNLDLSVCIKQ